MTIAEAHQRVTAIDGHNALRLYDAGDYYYLVERDPVKALEYAEKSLALRPRYVGALMLKGDALYATSRAAEAADYFDRAVGIEAQSGESRRWEAPWISYINFLADRSTNDGESGIKAMELLDEFRQRFPGSEQLPALEKAVQGS